MVTEYFFAEDIVFRHLYFDSQGGMVPRYFEFGGDCVFLVQDGGAIQLYVCDFESGMEVFFEPYIVVDIQESGRASHVMFPDWVVRVAPVRYSLGLTPLDSPQITNLFSLIM